MSPAGQDMTHLSPQEMEGGYRLLCSAMLVRTATVLHSPRHDSKELARQTMSAKRWIDGDSGLITFEDACSAVGLSPHRARSRLDAYIRCDRAINKRGTTPRFVFGRSSDDARRTTDHGRPDRRGRVGPVGRR